LLTVSFYFRLCISNAAERRKPSVKNSWDQGDQIGWFFARWVMFTLCSFFNYPSSRHFRVLFPTVKVMQQFWQKWVGPHCWAIFSQTHLVTLLEMENDSNLIQSRKEKELLSELLIWSDVDNDILNPCSFWRVEGNPFL
jgi:hypothetical protein